MSDNIIEPPTDSYVQPVPDKCDRIVWRGAYYHLPVSSSSQAQPVYSKSVVKRLATQMGLVSDNTEALLRRAFSLGQTYGAQADSESYAQNRRSEETRQKFEALVAEAALAQQAAPPAAQAEPPPRKGLPMQVLAALNEAMGGNEWQGDASPHELAVPASQAIAELAALAARGAQAEPDAWVSVEDRLPEPGLPVLVACGKKVLRAAHAPRFTLAEDEWGEFLNDSDYDEATDRTYWPEGWYEWNVHEETHWQLDDEPTHWQTLPAAPRAALKGQPEGGA
jgi:hypothetical protein